MADERLRLVLDLQNKASKELQRIQRDLGAVKPGAGMKNTASWFQQLEGASGNATKAIRPLNAGLNAIGVGGLAAGLSITSLIGQFRDLAKAAPALQELSRQTGMTKTQLERLKYAARDLNVDPAKMSAGLDAFSREMVQFSIASGRLYGEMQNGSAGLAQKIAKEWRDNPEAALKDYLSWLDAIPAAQKAAGKSAQEGAQKQRYWAGQMFGDEDMAQLLSRGMDGFNAALADAAKNVAPITDELIAQSQKLNESLNHLDSTWDNIKREFGPTVIGGITGAVDELKGVLEQVDKAHDRYTTNPSKLGDDAKQAGESIWDHFKKHWSEVGKGETPLLPNPFDSKSWHFPNPQGGLLDYSKPEDGPAPSGVSLKDLLTNRLPDFGGGASTEAGAPPYTAPPLPHPVSLPATRQLYSAPAIEEDRATRVRDIGGPQRASTAPPPVFQVPAGYNREMRARKPADDLDGFVVGSLEKPILHLSGSLKTAAAAISGDGIRPAAFHPAGFGGGALDPQAVITAGTKEGVLSAFRELAGMSAGTQGGIMAASFGGGGASGLWGGAVGRGGHAGSSNLRYGGAGRSPGQDLYATPAGEGGGTAQDNGAGFTAGMRARNLGNIGYFGQHTPGLVGPSNAHDVDHSIGLFATQEDGIRAAANLALKKYQGGRHSTWDLIAAKGGWTPGALGPGASKNVAAAMGLDNQSDTHLDQPGQMHKFLRGLAMQEHGKAGAFYSDAMIDRALSNRQSGSTTAGSGSLGSRDPVSIAEGMLGANGSQAQTMLKSRMTPGLWCADFVNGVLKGSGGKGMNSSMASAFSQWGSSVSTDMAKRGDVILENAHGRGINHVGMATGRVQRDANGHVSAVEMISGNYGETVRKNWEQIGKIAGMRRAAPMPIAPLPAIAPEPPRNDAPQSRRDDDPANLHVHLHQDGRVKSVRAKSSPGVQMSIRTAPMPMQTG